MQRHLKLFGILFGGLVLTFALLLALTIIGLHTHTGARLFGTVLSAQIPNTKIVGLGFSGRSLVLEAFALRDEQGIWLHGNGLTVTPDWLSLLGGSIGFNEIRLKELAWLRLPQTSAGQSEPFTLPELPTFKLRDALPHTFAKDVQVDAVHVADSLLPVAKTFHLQGDMNLNLHAPESSFTNLQIGQHGQPAGLQLHISAEKSTLDIRNNMALLLGQLVGLPQHKKLEVHLATTPDPAHVWSGKITATAEALLQHQTQVDIHTLSPLDIRISGENIGDNKDYLSANYTSNIIFDFNKNTVHLQHLNAQGSGLKLQAGGSYQTVGGQLDFKVDITADTLHEPAGVNCGDCVFNNLLFTMTAKGEAPYPNYVLQGAWDSLNMEGFSSRSMRLDAKATYSDDSNTDIPYAIEAQMNTQLTLSAPGATAEHTQLAGPLDITYRNNMLTLKADLDGHRDMHFDADFNWPLPLTTNLDTLASAPLKGRLQGQLLLGPLVRLLGMAEHRARGLVNLDATIAGNARNPKITGSLDLQRGFYENLVYGTQLNNITAQAVWDTNRLEVKQLSFNDGKKGTTSGNGYITLREADKLGYAFQLKAQQMLLVNTGGITVNSSGNLSLKGNEYAADLAGDVTIHRADIYLTRLPTGISGFDKYEIVDRHAPVEHTAAPTADDFDLSLDIAVKAAGNITARAQGFQSDWGADLKLAGSSIAPQLNGKLFLRRGRLELASLMVDLTRGNITFHGTPENPSLDIQGDVRGKGTDATLLVTGTAEMPAFTLRNTSDMPQEEIVSQLLFAQNTTELTPFQTIQIAQVLASLTGTAGDDMNPLDDLRRKTGLDTLSVSYDEETGTSSVAAGKYLSDKVYVGVEQGSTPGSSAVVTEINVNKRLSVETSVGGASQETKAGLKWRWDY